MSDTNDLVNQNDGTVTTIDNNELIRCVRCGQEKVPDKASPWLCVDCHEAEAKLTRYMKRKNDDWVGIAEHAGLELWERQPSETDTEWAVWVAYRAYYPGKRPTMRVVAEAAGCSMGTANYAKARWDYGMRMRAWARHIDQKIVDTRYQEIQDMNEKQINLAAKIHAKLEKAVDTIDLDNMKPVDLARLLSLSTEIERKARMDRVVSGEKISSNAGIVEAGKPAGAADGAGSKLKGEDIKEVLDILVGTGAIDLSVLTGKTGAAVKKVTKTVTTTTEVDREEPALIVDSEEG